MAPPGKRDSGPRRNAWNLLLLIPLISIVTPIFNRSGPELFGMPFFYWFQFVTIIVGVLCTSTVYFMTRDEATARTRSAAQDVDDLDEGTRR